VAADHDAGGSVPFEASHWAESGLEAPLVGFDPVVGVLGGVVKCSRQEAGNHPDQGVGPVSGDLSRLTMGEDRIGEQRSPRVEVTLLGFEHVDVLSVLVDGPVDVPLALIVHEAA
jgi:hypothetical protein